MPTIRCTITKDDVELELVEQKTELDDLYEALEQFETHLNDILTKMINNANIPDDGNDPVDEESDGSDSEGTSEQIIAKKMKTT